MAALKTKIQFIIRILLLSLTVVSTLSLVPQTSAATSTQFQPGPWTATTSLPAARYASSASGAVLNGYIYYIGGANSTSAAQSTVYYAQLSQTATVGTWNTTTVLPTAMYDTAVTTYNGYIYVVGGYNGTSPQSVVYYTKPNADGTITSWSTGTSLTTALYAGNTVASNGYLYFLGGFDGSSTQTSVYVSQINGSNGSLGAWSTTTVLPCAVDLSQVVANNGYIYIIAGNGASCFTGGTTYFSQINTGTGALGTWTSTSSLGASVGDSTAVVYNNYIYVIGGYVGSNSISTVYYAAINGDNTVSTWKTSTNPLPQQTGLGNAVVNNGYIYLMGGIERVSNVKYSSVYYASIRNTILNPVIDEGGGHNSTSTKYSLDGSVGQNAPFISTSTHYTLKSGYEYYDYGFNAPFINFSMSASSINFGTLSADTFYTGNNTATVTTNAIHGYNLYVQENHDMQNTSNATVTIPAFTGSSTTAATAWTTATTHGLGYNVSGSDVPADFVDTTYFRALDASAGHIIASTTGLTDQVNGDTTSFTYKVSISGTQSAGTYTNTVTLTVVGIY